MSKFQLRDRYLKLLQQSLIGALNEEPCYQTNTYDEFLRAQGVDWPMLAPSMIGEKRMTSLREMCAECYYKNIPGDFVECGVWRGGASMMMKGVEIAYRDIGYPVRKVWLYDSFEGLPIPEVGSIDETGPPHHLHNDILAVALERVERNFRDYDLLDDNVHFFKGWFKDTLPNAMVKEIAVLRLDGDQYASTMDCLDNLYHRVSLKGFVIIDDYHLAPCANAVDEFRELNHIKAPLIPIDGMGQYWIRNE